MRVIPPMIENAIKIALDPFFPEPTKRRYKEEGQFENKFELVFNEAVDVVGGSQPDCPESSDSDREEDTCEDA
jgi:hypothetical protein